MDAVLQALIREGGGWLTAALLLLILGATIKVGDVLLRREWARGDRQDAVLTQVVGQQEKLLDGLERMERQIDALRSRAR